MKSDSSNLRKEQAKEEFELILQEYILPMFNVRGKLKYFDTLENNKQLVVFTKDKDVKWISFYPCSSKEWNPSPFHFSIKVNSSEELVKRANVVLRELIKVAEFNYLNFSKQRDYGNPRIRSAFYKKRTFDLAYEFGLCKWLTKTEEDAFTLYTLISELTNWSSRTYEGKRTSFGFVIDFKDNDNNDSADYLSFLENDNSAVFTDGVFSGILLNKKGKVQSFIAKSNKQNDPNDSQELFAPFCFFEIVKHCIGSRIGVVVLTNGEIIIVRNKAICLSKHGNKWISYDWTRVYDNLRPYFLEAKKTEQDTFIKIKELYCTLLDVSFSHSGGCLALILPSEVEGLNKIIKERIDYFAKGLPLYEVSKESLEKMNVLMSFLELSPNNTQSFFEVNKPLRKEIMELDGATVISFEGLFFCAGSIVSVPGGSSGGGRTAAAKALAKYGIGIKISEDGYIEAFGKNLKSSEPRIVPLFKFK